jgi:hypothetical protein
MHGQIKLGLVDMNYFIKQCWNLTHFMTYEFFEWFESNFKNNSNARKKPMMMPQFHILFDEIISSSIIVGTDYKGDGVWERNHSKSLLL